MVLQRVRNCTAAQGERFCSTSDGLDVDELLFKSTGEKVSLLQILETI